MLYVLEGCDGAGKTTVAKHLKNILPDAEIIHCTRETPNDYRFFRTIIDSAENRNIIADRFCYGQFVYQTEAERHLTDHELTCLELDMIATGARVIHVTAGVDEIENRLIFRGEKTDIPVDEICGRYINLFESTIIKPHLWWTGEDY